MKTIMKRQAIYLPFLLLLFLDAAAARDRPSPKDAPAFSRWLVARGSNGVLNTLLSVGVPFSNVVLYRDGGKGTPYLYIPPENLDLINQTSSFTLSEVTIGRCNKSTDAQSPNCAKITLTGKLEEMVRNSKEAALFKTHPHLPGFQILKLKIQRIFLVNSFSPAKDVPVDQYSRRSKV